MKLWHGKWQDEMKRGEICWADLAPRSGAEQSVRRPVIVVSHDGFNQIPAWRSIIVIPMTTSASPAKRGPTVVELNHGATSLARPGFAVCHQVTTLDRAKLTKKAGTLSPAELREVEEGLKAAMDLE
jgi:mRNA interferase MazF